MKLTNYLIAAASWTLSACSEPTYGAQYYLDRPDKRQAKLAECENYGKLQDDANGLKARHAFTEKMLHGRGKLPKPKIK